MPRVPAAPQLQTVPRADQHQPTEKSVPFARSPSTLLTICLFIVPFIVSFGTSYVKIDFAQQTQAEDIATTKSVLKEWQGAKEQSAIDRAVLKTQLASVDKKVDDQAIDLKDIRADVKAILLRLGDR